MKPILRAMALLSGSSGVSLVLGLLSAKVTAVLLGLDGSATLAYSRARNSCLAHARAPQLARGTLGRSRRLGMALVAAHAVTCFMSARILRRTTEWRFTTPNLHLLAGFLLAAFAVPALRMWVSGFSPRRLLDPGCCRVHRGVAHHRHGDRVAFKVNARPIFPCVVTGWPAIIGAVRFRVTSDFLRGPRCAV